MTASLVCADMLNLKSEVDLLNEAKVDYIHFDVMDGHFVPRFGIHPEIMRSVRSMTSIPFDTHLMVANPEPYIPLFVEAGSNILTVHAEACPHLYRTILMIKKHGAKAGIALNPATSLDVLDYVLDDIDLVLIMAINPGILGQKLWKNTIRKIAELKEKISANHDHIYIQIDGGVTYESAPEMVNAGASMLVCGSSTIFGQEQNVAASIKKFRGYLNQKDFRNEAA